MPKRLNLRTCDILRDPGKWRPDIYNNMVGILKYIRMIFYDALNGLKIYKYGLQS